MPSHVPRKRPGYFQPLGATYDGKGVNFALFSENATAVELCLFDDSNCETRIRIPFRTLHVWHIYVADLQPGQRYGFRVHGPYEPERGLRFNPNKLLVDPYARMLDGTVDYSAPIHAYQVGASDDVRNDADDGWGVPKSVVVHDAFDWGSDAPPNIPWNDTVIYEMHVKGFTKLHPDVPEHVRGTYLGLATDAAIQHLKDLGITAVELLPVQEAMTEPTIVDRGLTNYWGYNTLSFFAPDQRFASQRGQQVREFKQMVKALHRAGIEVILDVVYNHSCEGSELGPTVSLRGIDNPTYYRLKPSEPRFYEDFTGCGNSLNVLHSQTLKLIMDSLRYWVTEMHVDGFRFDLATTLARESHSVDKMSAFFDIVHQDPVLSRIKLIAEPWDLGEDGYQVGNFPLLWTEWNGRFRDSVRRFWRGERSAMADLGYRLTGSSDLFQSDGRHPHASINFITAHDGFTLRDLVSYEAKHNEENLEENRDGMNDNLSDNGGVEGETSEPAILARRHRQQKNFLATLILSQGVPMLTMGDEMGRTQRGNNNLYCHDDEKAWLDWELARDQAGLLEFTAQLVRLRASHPVFRRRSFFFGALPSATMKASSAPNAGNAKAKDVRPLKDIAWFTPRGIEMTDCNWTEPEEAAIALLLSGDALDTVDETGEPVKDDTFLLCVSSEATPVDFRLPPTAWTDTWAENSAKGKRWETVLDTTEPLPESVPPQAASVGTGYKENRTKKLFFPGDVVRLAAKSIVVFRSPR